MKLYDEWRLGNALKAIDGEELKIASDRGIVVHFWSTSCPLCKRPMSELMRIAEKWSEQYTFVSVHAIREQSDTFEGALAEIEKQQFTIPVVYDEQMKISTALDNIAYPTYYIFDRTHKLRFKHASSGLLTVVDKRLQRFWEEKQDGENTQ
ncbi:MAG: TlpA disulfide reductase family protein [Bacilli bacterium]